MAAMRDRAARKSPAALTARRGPLGLTAAGRRVAVEAVGRAGEGWPDDSPSSTGPPVRYRASRAIAH
jgi:hypothetical protein